MQWNLVNKHCSYGSFDRRHHDHIATHFDADFDNIYQAHHRFIARQQHSELTCHCFEWYSTKWNLAILFDAKRSTWW